MSNEDLNKLVESNAKAIEALTNLVMEDRKRAAQDRRHVFEWMSRLAAAQADFYELQADHIDRLDKIEEKQTQMQTQILNILDRLVKKEQEE